MKQKFKTLFGKDKAGSADEKDEKKSAGGAAAVVAAAAAADVVARDSAVSDTRDSSSDEDEGDDVVSKAVSAAFSAEGFSKEKKIEKRWKVQANSTESGIEQSWVLTLVPKDKGGFMSAKATFDANQKGFSNGWYLDVRVILTLKALKDEGGNVVKSDVFRFSEKDKTHGWDEFVSSEALFSSDNIFRDPVSGNPNMEFSVQIVREKGCSGAFRAGFQHDSFQATGFCGLKNQGATCYLNSLLQALYWIAPFRASVYRLPTNDDQPNASIPLALQRLFYRLQFLNAPVSTTELTNSFGWGTRDVFMQHDVQELNRVLQDKIEEKMKGTTEEGQVAKLFRGKMVSYIKCLKVEYESKREEEFYDVSLVVKGCKNVYQSFDKYTETERLTGENQYRAEGHGLQDAEKGFRFIQFPPVLHLQLKRFDFDLESMRNYKIHSRYEFPRELDLSKYVDSNSPFRNDPAIYVLQGVMVHSGTAGGGHYYAYFRPSARKRWYKFNDTKVTRATSEEAVEGNFGSGSSGSSGPPRSGGMALIANGTDSYTSAYMLQYVRKDHFEACVSKVPMDVVPSHISLRFQEEDKERERKKQEKQDAEKYTFVKVFDEADLAAHTHFDLMDFDRVRPDRVFRVLNEWTIAQLKESLLTQAFGVDSPDRLQVRLFTRRRNLTVRASRLVDNDKNSIASFKNKDNSDNVKLLIEISKRDQAPFFDPPSDDECQVFFKFYNPVTRHLSYAGRFRMSRQQSPLSVEPQLRQLAGLGPTEPLQYYEEVRTDQVRIDQFDPSKSLEALDLGNGDIVVFQTIAPASTESQPAASASIEVADAPYPTAPLYYTFLKESISIRFRRVVDFEKDAGFSVMCIRSHNYEQLQDLVAKHLPPGVCDDPRKIEFTAQSAFANKPIWSGPFSYSSSVLTVNKMLQSYDRVLDTIFYEVLPFPLDVMRTKLILQTTLVGARQNVLFSGKAFVDRQGSCQDLLTYVRGLCPEVPADQELRVLSVSNSKVHQILKEQEPLTALLSRAPELVVEFVSPEEKTLEKGDKLVPCVHAEFDGYLTAFGMPFMFVLRKKETIGSVRARIQAKFGLSAEEIARWKFGVAESGYLSGFKPLADTEHLSPHNWTSGSYLAVVHTNTKKGSNSMHRQEGVVIRDAQPMQQK